MQTQVVTLDVLKPIGTTVDLSDSFNARVGDKMTPFQLFITEGGVAKDLKGMHPELEAEVGNGALRNGVAVMAAGAKGVHWVGSTNNVTGYNQLTLAFPAEVFPQSGFCYGHLILANDAGVRETSVDIWFQVFDGTPLMGLVADHYDSELQLELTKAKNANDQFSQEMRDTYNQKVTDAQNALIEARKNLQDVATTAGNINAQIAAQNIVTRSEFKDGMDDIRKNTYSAISNVTNGSPKPIKDLATLQAKLPDGDTGFYVTSDTGLKYAFVDGSWQSFGVYQATAMPEEDKANLDDLVKYRNKRNLVANNDWHTGDITNWYTIGNIDAEVQTGAYQGRNVLRIQNHGQSGDSWNGITSEPIPVIAGQPISEAVKACFKQDAKTDEGVLVVNFFSTTDGSGDRIGFQTQHIANSQALGFYERFSLENIIVPANAVTARLTLQVHGNGTLDVINPIFVHGSWVGAYDLDETNNLDVQGRNLLTDPEFNHGAGQWHVPPYGKVSFDAYYNGSRAMTYEVHDQATDTYTQINSKQFKVLPGSYLSVQDVVQFTKDADTDSALILINFYDDLSINSNRIGYKFITLGKNIDNWAVEELQDVEVPANAISANFAIQIVRNGKITFAKPIVAVTRHLGHYYVDDYFINRNLIDDPEFNDLSQWVYPQWLAPSVTKDTLTGHNMYVLEQHGITQSNYAPLYTKRIAVKPNGQVKGSVKLRFTPDTNMSDTALVVINEYADANPTSDRLAYTQKVLTGTINDLTEIVQKVRLQSATCFVELTIQLPSNGRLEIEEPCLQYQAFAEDTSTNRNLLTNSSFNTIDVDADSGLNLAKLEGYYRGMSALEVIRTGATGAAQIRFETKPVNHANRVSTGIMTEWKPAVTGDMLLLVTDFLDENFNRIDFQMCQIRPTNTMRLTTMDNLPVPDKAVYMLSHLEFSNSNGELKFANPLMTLTKHQLPYRIDDLADQLTTTDLPIINLVGDLDGMNKDKYKLLSFEYRNGSYHVEGFADTKWQGDSSLSFDKKSYRIKTYKDADKKDKLEVYPQASWQAGSKWNLKANFADATYARNVVNARIGAAVTATNATVPQQLITAPNFGQIDGFPVKVYLNFAYQGIYTFNYTKDVFGKAVAGVTGDHYNNATLFNADEAKYDGSDFEALTDDFTDDFKTSFNRVLKFVHTSSDDDFKAHLDEYMDVNSVIDYLIFQNVIANTDCWGKNAEYITYNGTKWYALAYDLDIAYGSTWDGSSIDANAINKSAGIFYSSAEGPNLLFKRTNELFADQVKARYAELRHWLTPAYVLKQYQEFIDSVGEQNYKDDQRLWNPHSKNLYTLQQLQEYIYKRFQILDGIWKK
ncbi:CotH kinase family protein [Limosilactobacillus reuteri]|uniref:CotH kinase family protein n=2 Tax=Limosilactobacillus reuteri TaxID=1598 RepID=UPI001E3AB99E|nr:CotH kinase family protein [Limosilactobacillus reuteri]MCC4367570.1 CotH kinase family protein [Limosilactobacillus reuteri]